MENRMTKNLPAPLQQLNVPAKTSVAIDHLSACLALVRPVGMSDDAATEWLTIAATELKDLPAGVLERAAKQARQKCSHHGQIIPAILATQDVATWRAGESLSRAMRTEPPQLPRGGARQIGSIKVTDHD